MKTLIRENDFLPRGFGSFSMDFGWGNGYVLIPREHCLWGVDYDNIPVDVHGGLTFSTLVIPAMLENDNQGNPHWPGLVKEDVDCWMVGFDTVHCRDTLVKWPKEAVQAETDHLKEQLEAFTSFIPSIQSLSEEEVNEMNQADYAREDEPEFDGAGFTFDDRDENDNLHI